MVLLTAAQADQDGTKTGRRRMGRPTGTSSLPGVRLLARDNVSTQITEDCEEL